MNTEYQPVGVNNAAIFKLMCQQVPDEQAKSYSNISNHYYSSRRTSIPRIITTICMVLLFMGCCNCTQIQIIGSQNVQEIKQLNLLKSLRKYRKKLINLNSLPYVCVTAIKQKSTDLSTVSTNKTKRLSQYVKGNVPTLVKVQPYAYEKSLGLLDDNIGVRHYTKQFIYGYKHKKIVSQFDDQMTKYANQKKQLQNYTMGLFQDPKVQPQTVIVDPPKVQLSYPTYENYFFFNQEFKKNTDRVNIVEQLFTPLTLRQSQDALMHIHIDHSNSIVQMTRPLRKQKPGQSKTYNITFMCQRLENASQKQENATQKQQFYLHNILGISLTKYQILTISEIPKNCFQIKQIYKQDRLLLGFNPNINTLDNLIVGDLDKMCTQNSNNGVQIGDYLLIQSERIVSVYQVDKTYLLLKQKLAGHTFNNFRIKTKPITEHFVVQVTDIIGQNLYVINSKLPMTLKPTQCRRIQAPSNKYIGYGGQIDFGSYILRQNQQIQNINKDKVVKFQYRGARLVKIQADANLATQNNHNSIKTGLQLMCFSQISYSIAPYNPTIFNMGVTIGKKFGDNYFQIHPWIDHHKLFMLQSQGRFLGRMVCVPMKTKYQSEDEDTQPQIPLYNSIHTVIKMSKNRNDKLVILRNNEKTKQQLQIQEGNVHNKEYSLKNQIKQDSIIMLTLGKGAVIQIMTTNQQRLQNSEQGSTEQSNLDTQNQKSQVIQNKYLLIQRKIYKIQTITKNGTTVRVQRVQNQLYQNSTNQNAIIIYKGIWRSGDFVKYPRFLFHKNQRITSVSIKHGSAFVRVTNLNQINKQLFAVSSSDLESSIYGYGPKVRPQKSIATEYRYKWGGFCGGTINKNRQTLVKIKCGQPWFKMQSVVQVSPCSYQIQIISQFLCDENVIFPPLKQGFNIFNGTICIEAKLYDS